MLKSCTCFATQSESMEAPMPRPVITNDTTKQNSRSTTLKRKGSTLQTSVEVFRCKYGKNRQPGNTTETDHQFAPSKDWTPVYHAIYHQREAALAHFLRIGESSNDVIGVGVPPLCLAVAGGNIDIARLLLQSGADVDATTEANKETALHIAIRLNHGNMVELLLSYRPELYRGTADSGETPLHYAASRSSSLATVVSLLQSGAKYDALNTKGQTPAEAALLARNLHAAVAIINTAPRRKLIREKEMLLKHVQKTQGRFSIGNDLIADIFSAACDPDSTVLVEAIKRDDASLVEMFLEKGSDPDRQTARGDRPIFVALECAGAPVVQALVKHKADVLVRDPQGLTVLQAAFEGPLAQDNAAVSAIFDVLLKKGANPAVKYPDGDSLLHRTVSPQFGNARVAHLLIAAGVKVNSQGADGNTALHIATHSKACAELLLKHGADTTLENSQGLTPLLFATTYGTQDVETDLTTLIKMSDLRKTNSKGQTALHLAAAHGLEKTIISLLRARADTTIVDVDKNTPLILAVKSHQWATVPILTIPPSINSWDADGLSALHHIARSTPRAPATWKDIADAARPFCERGVSRSMRDRSGATPLIQAVVTLPEEGLPVVETLLIQKAEQGASCYRNCVSHEDHKMHDALYYAATMSKPLFVEALLKHGAVFEFKEWTTKSKRLDATVVANHKIMTLIAQYEWARRAGSIRRHSSGHNAESSMISAVFPVKDIKHMISMGLDVNALPRSSLGNSMLWAILRHIPTQPSLSSKYLFEVIELILDSGGDPNACTARGGRRSPSPQSSQNSRESLPLSLHPLTFLLEECPTVEIDLIILLVRKGTKLSSISPFYDGQYPLHSAVRANRLDIVDEFLLQRVDVNAADQNGRTALFFAAEKGFWEILDSLLRHGAKMDAKDHEGNTPLHAAATHGARKVIEALLRAGAKAAVRNGKGVVPLACLPDDLDEKDRDRIKALLKKAEEKERRIVTHPKPNPEQFVATVTKPKQGNEAKEDAHILEAAQKQRRPIQEKQQVVPQQQKELEKARTPSLPTEASSSPPPRPIPTVPTPMTKSSKSSSSIFRNPSFLFARPKIVPPTTTTAPKQTPMVTMRLTTPPTFSLSMAKPSTEPSQTPPQPGTTAMVVSTATLSVPVSKAPRVDSGIGPSKPVENHSLKKAGDTLDADTLTKALNVASSRDSGHELKDWLAVSRMIDNL